MQAKFTATPASLTPTSVIWKRSSLMMPKNLMALIRCKQATLIICAVRSGTRSLPRSETTIFQSHAYESWGPKSAWKASHTMPHKARSVPTYSRSQTLKPPSRNESLQRATIRAFPRLLAQSAQSQRHSSAERLSINMARMFVTSKVKLLLVLPLLQIMQTRRRVLSSTTSCP